MSLNCPVFTRNTVLKNEHIIVEMKGKTLTMRHIYYGYNKKSNVYEFSTNHF